MDPRWLQPFWLSETMWGETLFFVEDVDGRVTAPLLFAPGEIIALESATREVTFEEGRDYLIDRSASRVVRPPLSRLPFTTQAELYPSRVPEVSRFMHRTGDASAYLMHAEDDTFHRRQALVSYRHESSSWYGTLPVTDDPALSATRRVLHDGHSLRIDLFGDSITEGYNASAYCGAPPQQSPYGMLVAAEWTRSFGAAVSVRNLATAYTSSDAAVVDDWDEGAGAPPHLVVIAYGMNDAGYAEAADFAVNIVAIMEGVRRRSPGAEFVLVSPMLPNPEWHYTATGRFPAYRAALARLCGPGVALADLTTLWSDLLCRKRVYDLSGNGINHPNDFGHRLYAQVILALLGFPADRLRTS